MGTDRFLHSQVFVQYGVQNIWNQFMFGTHIYFTVKLYITKTDVLESEEL